MECPECHIEVLEDSNFCSGCGYHFAEAQVTTDAPVGTESERKHVTIMFSDLAGYTATTEKLNLEEFKEPMNRIFFKDGGCIVSMPPDVEDRQMATVRHFCPQVWANPH